MSEVVGTDGLVVDVEPVVVEGEQTADTPGNDENGDGVKGGQATADAFGDILGV